MNFNKVILGGNLTRDVEMKSASNTTIGSFGMAVNRKYKTQSGEQREETTFVDCTAFGRTAEAMAQYLSKGSSVLIEGRLKLDQWDDKATGAKRSKLSVTVDQFTFVGGGDKAESKPRAKQVGGSGMGGIDHDLIPFSMNPAGGLA